MSEEKRPRLKFKELPKELSTYFIKRIVFCAFLLIGLIVFFILAHKIWKVALVLSVAYLIFVGYNIVNYLQVTSYKIKVYLGTVEKKDESELIGGKKFGVKGPCSLIVIPSDAADQNMKYIVPVGSGFDCDPGNVVAVYSNPNDIYQKTDNAYYFNNPMLVSVKRI